MQTQTPLTSCWFIHRGFSWGCGTPAGGSPWAISFEILIFQIIFAYIYKIFGFGFSSDVTAYLTNYVFFCVNSRSRPRYNKEAKPP